jgi:adenylate kinase family enzyme
MDGNYSMARDIIWHYADTLIWLDFPLPVILYRLLRRSLHRIIYKETLWNGNRETWRGLFLSRDSLLLWAVKKHRPRRGEFLALFQKPDFAHLTIYRFRTPAALAKWVSSLP